MRFIRNGAKTPAALRTQRTRASRTLGGELALLLQAYCQTADHCFIQETKELSDGLGDLAHEKICILEERLANI
jgi:hypothetical protein